MTVEYMCRRCGIFHGLGGHICEPDTSGQHMPTTIKIKLLHDGAKKPRYMTDGAACADLFAGAGAVIAPGQIVLVPTGIAFEIPTGYEIQVRPRSGTATRDRLLIPNTPATIDSDYRGEVFVPLLNYGGETYRVAPGDRIAQFKVAPAPQARFEVVEELSETDRGTDGFGSTGR